MKKLFKILTPMAAILAAALFFAGCKQFLEDPEEFLSYWAAEVVSGDYIIDKPTQTNTDGVQCIPSTSDVRLTVKLNNPKNFTLVMPTSPANAGKVINFPGLSPQPAYGTDYTLQQAGSTLNLVYKSAFLKKHEWNTGNIGPEITLIADDGREFSKPFKAHVEVNTPPKLSFTGSIGKTVNPIGGKHYYVIILKAEDMSETAGIGSSTGKLHKDIKRLTVEGGNSENISFTAGHTAFTVDTSTPVTSRRLLAVGEVTNITSADLNGQTPPSWNGTHNADPWALRYRTGTEVKGAQALYKFRLYDEKGLISEEVSASTVKIKAQDVRLYKDPSDPSTEITTLMASESSPYEITVPPGTQDVTVTAKTETAGATIAGRVDRYSGSWVPHGQPFTADTNNHPIRLTALASAGGTIQYKISLTAGGIGFDNSNEKIFYVTVKTDDTTTINSGTDAWEALKHAVEQTGYTTIKINGTIIAPNGPNKQINVRRNVTIQGTNTTNDKLQGTPNTYIFDISGDGNLTLKKLTLQGGKNKSTSTGGGAIYCAGAALTTDNVIIQSCEAKNGGAIYAKEVTSGSSDRPSVITLKNTQIKSCTAQERGGAIYCAKSTLTLDHTTIGGNAATEGNTAKKGGGIYFAGGSEECTIPSGCTIQHNKTTIESGRTSGGGGVYVQSGTLTLGGTISDNSALVGGDALASGGGVFVGAQGKFIMKSGATISGNKAKWGGGIYVYADNSAGAGSFTMEGGTISGCHAGGSGYSSAKGGGVCIKAAGAKKGSFTMQGGEITGCTAEANTANEATGGGVYVEARAVFKMSGGAVITPLTPNTATNSFNDVYLDHEGSDLASITVTDDLTAAPTAAILTMMDRGSTPGVDSGYYPGRVVVKGSSIDTEGGYKLKPTDAAKFQVTPQTRPPQNWKVVHDGNTSGALRLDP